MRFWFLLVLASALVACTQTPVDEAYPIESDPALAQSDDTQAVLYVANHFSHDDLTAHGLDPAMADAILTARANGIDFASPAQVEETMTLSLPPSANPLCAYYEAMAQYFSIRALQCAYSICYPMSPWYGFMAEYYRKLLRSLCPE
jgi:hypothetical protein